MMKTSIALAILGIGLLLLSFAPWPSSASQTSDQMIGTTSSTVAGEQSQAAPDTATAARGRALFLAKGCVACHRHDAVSAAGISSIGPDLTTYKGDPQFLRNWLNDPSAVRPGTEMPTLGLKAEEIEALIAFLNLGASR